MKKTLTTLLSLLIFATTFAYDVQIDNIYYNLDHKNNTAVVTHDGKYTDENNSGYTQLEITIPATISYNGVEYNITSIGNNAFYKNATIKSISITNGVTSIGNSAFSNCSELATVSIPNSVNSIGSNAFFYCSSLTSVTMPEKITTIKNYTFYNCTSLPSITIPDSVTTIENYAFSSCSSLQSITIPPSVTKIGNNSFGYCSSLTSIFIPAALTSIGERAFRSCTFLASIDVDENNPSYASIDGILYDKNITTLIRCPDKKTSVTIPNTVTTIEKAAFENCKLLTSLVIPENVTTINEYSFAVCTSLTSFTIPDNIKRIPPYALYNCTGLRTVSISDSVNYIGNSAFAYCYALNSITIPNNIHIIEKSTFTSCSRLQTVKLGNAIDTIRSSAFKGCARLETLKTSTKIPPVIDSTSFAEVSNVLQIEVPCNTTSAYKNAKHWSKFDYVENIHSLTVVPNDETMGYVLIMKKPSCESPTTELQANAFQNTDYRFKEWSDGTKENPYIFELTCDTTLTAIFELAPTPVENINNSQIKIFTTDNTIHIEGLTNDYQIHTSTGQLIYSGKQTSISLPKGIYILTTNNYTQKIIL